MGSSRDSEVRWSLTSEGSVVLTGGVVAAEPDDVGDLGAGGLSSSIAGGFFSTEGATIVGAVIERVGAVRPVMIGEVLSLAVLTVGSTTTVDVGFGRAKP